MLWGFQTDDELVFRRMFSDICSFLDVGTMELSSVVKIGNTGLFRAKNLNRGQKMVLMNNVKRLRQSEQYKSVYIQWDLAYRQHQDMMSRRAALAGSGDPLANQVDGVSQSLGNAVADISLAWRSNRG